MTYRITDEMIYAHSMGPNPIVLLKWNLDGVSVASESRILDLGSGWGLTSVYLANELDSEVIACDKGIDPSKALEVMLGCKPERVPLPLKVDVRDLPFAGEYFDMVIATDSYIYFGTDDLFAPYIARYLRRSGLLCFTVPGLNKDVASDSCLPEHLRPFWADECWTWHTKDWWKSHIERTGHFVVEHCEAMDNPYDFWKEETMKGPKQWRDNDLPVVEADKGEYMGFIKVIAKKVG